MLSIIAAKTKNNVIGVNNTLPWKQRNDLQRFKALTYGKKVFMGMNTFKSLGNKPLPNRLNYVVSRMPFEEAVAYQKQLGFDNLLIMNGDIFLDCYAESKVAAESLIIGGEQIYKLAIDKADRLYITELNCELEGDVFFPEIDPNLWKVVAKEEYKADEFNQYDYSFLTYVRK